MSWQFVQGEPPAAVAQCQLGAMPAPQRCRKEWLAIDNSWACFDILPPRGRMLALSGRGSEIKPQDDVGQGSTSWIWQYFVSFFRLEEWHVGTYWYRHSLPDPGQLLRPLDLRYHLHGRVAEGLGCDGGAPHHHAGPHLLLLRFQVVSPLVSCASLTIALKTSI